MMDYPLSVLNEPCNTNIPHEGQELNLLVGELLHGQQGVAPDASRWQFVSVVIERMIGHGFWLLLKSPFAPDKAGADIWWAGFTPHGVSGWNGTPDYYASAPTGPLAICRAAVLWLVEGAKDEEENGE